MKITDIRTKVMGVPPRRNWIFVFVETDAGITGIGEATTEWHEQAVVAAIEQLIRPRLIGEDPTRIERIWTQMHRHNWWRGGVVVSSALSGIDQALWDLAGKAYGQPVYRLLGGACRDRIRLYARADLQLGDAVTEIRRAQEEGFPGYKCGYTMDAFDPFDERAQIEHCVAEVSAVREAAGPEMELMIDCGGLFSFNRAVELVERLRPFRMLFVEEPVNADTPRELVALRRAGTGVPIAAGERVNTRWGFREWLEQGAVDVIQADVSHCGGISELLKIARYAEVYNVRIAPHNPYGPVALAASAHAAMAMANFLILEHCRLRPWFDEVQTMNVPIKEGCVVLTERPGLGIELDEAYIDAHPYVPLGTRDPFYGDGAPALV